MALWQFGANTGTHALVVGVGHYPHLPGGGGALYPKHGGMGQLTSAPVSAKAVADWLATSYQSTPGATHPLSSLEMLISDTTPATYEPRPGAGAQPVERATFANFEQAVLGWYQRLNQSPDNRAVFFFCGHGIAAGIQSTLLLEDFGRVTHAALRHALDFNKFHLGMDQCAARTQCFFVDSCRVASATLLNAFQSYGESILTPPNRFSTPPRKAPAFFSTVPGASAYGRPGQTSFFTEALLQALQGSGSAKHGGAWTILPSVLYRALERLMARVALGSGATQSCGVEHLADFPLHVLPRPPTVPVSVDCNNPIDLATAVLRVTGTLGSREQLPPVPKPWDLELPTGQYRFLATPPSGTPHVLDEIVFPPYTDVVLP